MSNKPIENKVDIEALVDGSPKLMIQEMAKHDLDFSNLKVNFGHEMAKTVCGVTETDFQAIDFFFWFSYAVEKTAEDLIIEPEVEKGASKKSLTLFVENLNFWGKVKSY